MRERGECGCGKLVELGSCIADGAQSSPDPRVLRGAGRMMRWRGGGGGEVELQRETSHCRARSRKGVRLTKVYE